MRDTFILASGNDRSVASTKISSIDTSLSLVADNEELINCNEGEGSVGVVIGESIGVLVDRLPEDNSTKY